MLAGSNLIVGKILEFIHDFDDNKKRLLHIHGPEGYGKTDVANFAAEYAVKGRVTLHRALFIDGSDKNSTELIKS